jgi:multidrug transporter EmrE-like cation transporter
MAIFYLIIAFILNSAGNIFFKIASNRGFVFHGPLLDILSGNYLLIVGFVLYAINALFYALALRSFPLSIAYPVMIVMSLLIITSISVIFLNEHINTLQMVGYGLLIISIIIIFYFGMQ